MLNRVFLRFGALCINKNNHYVNKICSDYKSRFCCRKKESSAWGPWEAWSDCTKSCGGGTQFTTRRCNEKGKDTCFGNWKDQVDGQDKNLMYKKIVRKCNIKECASKNFSNLTKKKVSTFLNISRLLISTLARMDCLLGFL